MRICFPCQSCRSRMLFRGSKRFKNCCPILVITNGCQRLPEMRHWNTYRNSELVLAKTFCKPWSRLKDLKPHKGMKEESYHPRLFIAYLQRDWNFSLAF